MLGGAHAFEYARDFSDGLAVVKISNRYGYIDMAGKLKIPPVFLFADDFKDGKAFVRDKNKVDGFIDKSGRFVFILNMSSIAEIDSYSCDRVLYKKLNGKYGLLDGVGTDVLREGYEKIRAMTDCNYVFKKGGRWGIMNRDGVVKLKPIYHDISRGGFNNSLLAVKYENEWVYVDKSGKVILR